LKQVKKSSKSISIAHDYARLQEIEAAKTYNGWTTPNSGAGNIKGDVRVRGKFRIECKCTLNNSYGLKYDYLENFLEQAASLGEDPVMQLHFINDNGTKKRGYIIVPEEYIKDYLING
jgi:hypothetical protein